MCFVCARAMSGPSSSSRLQATPAVVTVEAIQDMVAGFVHSRQWRKLGRCMKAWHVVPPTMHCAVSYGECLLGTVLQHLLRVPHAEQKRMKIFEILASTDAVDSVLSAMRREVANARTQLLGLALLVLLHEDLDMHTPRPDYDFDMLFGTGQVRQSDDGHLPSLHGVARIRTDARYIVPGDQQRCVMLRAVLLAIQQHCGDYRVFVWGLDLLLQVRTAMASVALQEPFDETEVPDVVAEFINAGGVAILMQSAHKSLVPTVDHHYNESHRQYHHHPRCHKKQLSLNVVVWNFLLCLHNDLPDEECQTSNATARPLFVDSAISHGGILLITQAILNSMQNEADPSTDARVVSLVDCMTHFFGDLGYGDNLPRSSAMCQHMLDAGALAIYSHQMRADKQLPLLLQATEHEHGDAQGVDLEAILSTLHGWCSSLQQANVQIAESGLIMLVVDNMSRGRWTPHLTLEYSGLLQTICLVPEACHVLAGIQDTQGDCAFFRSLMQLLCRYQNTQVGGSRLRSIYDLLPMMINVAVVRQDRNLSLATTRCHAGRRILQEITSAGPPDPDEQIWMEDQIYGFAVVLMSFLNPCRNPMQRRVDAMPPE